MAPTLSVITTIDAVHNHDPGGAICELLKGMKNQSSPPAWELVFVNQPGHPIGPEAEAALEELATECTVRRSMAPQAGRAAAHNRGAEVARGDLLLFLGSDFRPRSALLRAHVDLHRDRPEAGVVGLGGALFPDEPWRTPFMRWMDRRGHTFGTRFLDGGRPPARFFYAVNTSVKRTFFERVGPFREELVGGAGDDYEWGLRAFGEGMDVVYLPKAMADHIHDVRLPDRGKQVWESGYARGLLAGRRAGGPRVGFLSRGTLRRHGGRLLRDAWNPLRVAWHLYFMARYTGGYFAGRRRPGDTTAAGHGAAHDG